MDATQRPELDWIDIDTVVQHAITRFRKSAEKVRDDALDATRVEPTLALVRAGLTGKSLNDSDALDLSVSLTKTIQNAVGLFHQDVLGSVPGWTSTGAAGGAIDLRGTSPITGQEIVAEVKMRYNTIKASDEKNVWDDLKHAAQIAGAGSASYVFQIVPKANTPYDRPWSVSGRPVDERVRAADGVTAYHLVTGNPDALRELLAAMPYVTRRLAEATLGSHSAVDLAFQASSAAEFKAIVDKSLPPHSAHQ